MISLILKIGDTEYTIKCDMVIVKNHKNEIFGQYKCTHDDYTMNVNLSYCDKFIHKVNCNMDKVTVWK